jgi:glycosyltransferase involved in cell wall biosynthesis
MKTGFIIPVFNHGKPLREIVEKLAEFNLPIIVIDDGSDEETKKIIEEIAIDISLVTLVTLQKNMGKGKAVITGLEEAHKLDLTHALQIDADGQHDIEKTAFFLERSALEPQMMICAFPIYDKSSPSSRKNGRIIANTWAKIVTFSDELLDVMCGFRVYLVEPALTIARNCRMDLRMGFDIEILIRLYWMGINFRFFPIRVSYPKDGVSHFHIVRDNLRISFVFARLFCATPPRFFSLLKRRKNRDRNVR